MHPAPAVGSAALVLGLDSIYHQTLACWFPASGVVRVLFGFCSWAKHVSAFHGIWRCFQGWPRASALYAPPPVQNCCRSEARVLCAHSSRTALLASRSCSRLGSIRIPLVECRTVAIFGPGIVLLAMCLRHGLTLFGVYAYAADYVKAH